MLLHPPEFAYLLKVTRTVSEQVVRVFRKISVMATGIIRMVHLHIDRQG